MMQGARAQGWYLGSPGSVFGQLFVGSLAACFQDDGGNGHAVCMAQRQVQGGDREGLGDGLGPVMEDELGATIVMTEYLAVMKLDPVCPAAAEGLHGRLFGRPAHRQMRGRIGGPQTIVLLGAGENPFEKTSGMAAMAGRYPGDGDAVGTQADNH